MVDKNEELYAQHWRKKYMRQAEELFGCQETIKQLYIRNGELIAQTDELETEIKVRTIAMAEYDKIIDELQDRAAELVELDGYIIQMGLAEILCRTKQEKEEQNA
jgi:hypothetical protein